MNPWEQVGLVLAESKREGLPWEEAWFKALRTLSPEKTTGYGPTVHDALALERDLMREVRPWFQAAYEDREVTADEFDVAVARTEKRLDQLLAVAA